MRAPLVAKVINMEGVMHL